MIHSPQLFISKKGGNVLHTSNIIECDLNEVKNSISERLMVNRLVTVTVDREKNQTQSQFGWLDSIRYNQSDQTKSLVKNESSILSKCFHVLQLSGEPKDGFLLNTLKTLFRLSRVLLDLQKSILSGSVKFVSVRSSQGNLSLFEITRASDQYYFPKILDQ